MPADLVPHAEIPGLATQLTAEMIEILRYMQKSGFILNGSGIDPDTTAALSRLTDLGLIDPGYEGDTRGAPYLWASNGNGARVLGYLASIPVGPYYELPCSELAAWLEEQGNDRWWNVDGDPLLTGRMTFPCPAGDLARELRAINRPLLVQANESDAVAKGQVIRKENLNVIVSRFDENLHVAAEGKMPPWSGDRFLYLCWKGSPDPWLLEEDSETTEQMGREVGHGEDAAKVQQE